MADAPATNMNQTESPLHIVALGASAGGLSALEQFFAAMPTDSGMAFVVIQHLSPDFKSLMDDLLARHTSMPIRQATNGTVLEPNTIYLSPSRFLLNVADGRIVLHEKAADLPFTLPIDACFHSLAADARSRAIAIVLSGTGSDGSRGIRSINESGGLVVVQSPESAQFDGMPRNAIASGCYDFQLSPERMPRLLLEYLKDPAAVRQRVSHTVETYPEDGEFAEIFALLRRGYNVDFSKYKTSTVGRRIKRRIEMRLLSNVDDYVAIVAGDAEELDTLYHDLLIGVTEFFRDPDAFAYLATVIAPELMAAAHGNDELRIWSSGTATGEEAYSLAIIFSEVAEQLRFPGKITIFATDVHRRSLDAASRGIYNRDRLKNVSEERLARFFRQDLDDTWRVSQDLRRMVVFAPHNLINDPPFTKTDLICCRNMLIYLQPEVQDRVLATFHYSLKISGVLFLGSSEGLGTLAPEFETLNSHDKLYRKRREVRLHYETRTSSVKPPVPTLARAVQPQNRGVTIDRQLLRDYDYLLGRSIPAGVLIDENRQVLHYFGDFRPYQCPVVGRFDKDILTQLAESLHIAVSTTLQRAMRENCRIALKGVQFRPEDSEPQRLTISAEPISDNRSQTVHFFLEFRPEQEPVAVVLTPPVDATAPCADDQTIYRRHIADLDQELRLTRENLQAANEELQTTNEELQATNEELLAANEELQSTNEELHSVNEELFTVNSEFERKNIELAGLNLDHENLLTSIDTGVVFVDERLCIRKFNAAVSGFFRLVPHDIGRPIEHIAYHLTGKAHILDDIRTVLVTGQDIEKEDSTPSGSRHVLIRIMPFRTESGKHGGVVVLFTDITRIKEAEQMVRQLHEELRRRYAELGVKYQQEQRSGDLVRAELRLQEEDLLETQRIAGLAAFKWDLPAGKVILSDSFRQFFPELDVMMPVEKDQFLDLFVSEDREHLMNLMPTVYDGERKQFNLRLQQSDGTLRHMLCSMRLRKAGETDMLVGIIHDMTERMQYEQMLEMSRDQAEAANQAKSAFLATMSHEIRTPLNAVIGLSQLLEREQLTPDQQAMVRQVNESGKSLLLVINDILDMSKIDAGQLHVELRPFSLTRLLDRVHDMVRRSAQDKGLALHVDTLCEELDTLIGDDLRLVQVIVNLLSNAVKFTKQGEIRLRVYPAALSESAARLRFEVSDTGIGIPAEAHSSIFTPFFQADSTITRQYGGTGLGLSISKNLVELMGGTIGFESASGAGALFWCELPFQRTRTVTSPNAQPSRAATCQSGLRLAGLRVLVVDDSAINQDMIARALKMEGAEVMLADDGKQAVETLRNFPHHFHAILMDIQMPEMDGITATRQLRRDPGLVDLPIFALTAGVMAKNIELAREAGMNGFLPKPINIDELISLLETCECAAAAAPDRECSVSPGEEPSGNSMLTVIKGIPGLDPGKVMEAFGDNDHFFKEIFGKFVVKFADSATQITAFLADGDRLSAQRLLHKLGGTALSIGLPHLAETAAHVEQAIESQNDDFEVKLTELAGQFAEFRQAIAVWNTDASMKEEVR